MRDGAPSQHACPRPARSPLCCVDCQRRRDPASVRRCTDRDAPGCPTQRCAPHFRAAAARGGTCARGAARVSWPPRFPEVDWRRPARPPTTQSLTLQSESFWVFEHGALTFVCSLAHPTLLPRALLDACMRLRRVHRRGQRLVQERRPEAPQQRHHAWRRASGLPTAGAGAGRSDHPAMILLSVIMHARVCSQLTSVGWGCSCALSHRGGCALSASVSAAAHAPSSCHAGSSAAGGVTTSAQCAWLTHIVQAEGACCTGQASTRPKPRMSKDPSWFWALATTTSPVFLRSIQSARASDLQVGLPAGTCQRPCPTLHPAGGRPRCRRQRPCPVCWRAPEPSTLACPAHWELRALRRQGPPRLCMHTNVRARVGAHGYETKGDRAQRQSCVDFVRRACVHAPATTCMRTCGRTFRQRQVWRHVQPRQASAGPPVHQQVQTSARRLRLINRTALLRRTRPTGRLQCHCQQLQAAPALARQARTAHSTANPPPSTPAPPWALAKTTRRAVTSCAAPFASSPAAPPPLASLP